MATTITVTGMSCDHCEQTVERALGEVPGVTRATADREAEWATVDGDVDVEKLLDAVENAGYDAEA